MTEDIRWQQRFANFQQALKTLAEAFSLAKQRPLSELERLGVIQGFEVTHELAWNVLKDYLEDQGYVDLIGSKNVTRTAFKNNLIDDGDVWMEMIKARNLTSHTYNTETAEKISGDILNRFYPAFVGMQKTFADLMTSQTPES